MMPPTFTTKNYTYNEREQVKKVVTTISQYYYDIDKGYDSDKSRAIRQSSSILTMTMATFLYYSGPEYNGGHVEYTYAPPKSTIR